MVITSTNSATLKEHSLSLIVVNEFLEILRCEIYFDTSAMVEKSLSVSLDKEKDHDPAEMSEIPSLVSDAKLFTLTLSLTLDFSR